MNAGRELDALIAEKIIGWTEIESIKNSMQHGSEYYGKSPTSEPSPHTGYVTKFKVPSYSTDISAAWEVVEKMRDTDLLPGVKDKSTGFVVGPYFKGGYKAYFEWHEYTELESIAETAPHAICLTALKAFGVSLDKT